MLITLAIIVLTLIFVGSITDQITQNREKREIEKRQKMYEEHQKIYEEHQKIYEERQKIDKERQKLYTEVLDYLRSSTNVDSILKEYDDTIKVNSRQALNNYNDIKYLKENNCLDRVTNVTSMCNHVKNDIKNFLKQNNFKYRPQYDYVKEQLNRLLSIKSGYCVRVVYITPVTRQQYSKLINFSEHRLKEINNHLEWIMSKAEYNKMRFQQLYQKVNSIIDFANDARDFLIANTMVKKLDDLIKQLLDAIYSSQRIKQADSQECHDLLKFIINIETQVRSIVDDDKKISDYYASEDFKKIKKACNSLHLSHKEFNEYIDKKAQSISKLFGARAVRNEKHYEGIYSHIHKYKNNITPFTVEVSASVFESAEINPINYIIKFFYPNKNQYEEQITKLKTLIKELQTLKEAKEIINKYKNTYRQYITDIPDYILKNDEDGFYSRLGLAIINKGVFNVEYKFVYTPNGKITPLCFTVPMSEDNIIKLINSLESKLPIKSSAKEHIKMTTKFRRSIIQRDKFTCRQCGNSIKAEPDLLFEIDHVIPISKGGLTTDGNIRTLCWRCIRRNMQVQ